MEICHFLALSLFLWPIRPGHGRQIQAEFLSRGARKFYFNSCHCGLLDVNEQDITSERAKERNAEIERNLRDLYAGHRRRREITPESGDARTIQINLKLTIDLGSQSGNFSGQILNPADQPPRHGREKGQSFRTLDQIMLDEYSVELEAFSGESQEEEVVGPAWRRMGSKDTNYTGPQLRMGHKVIKGIVAERGQAPWQVLLENMNSGEICGGAIINQRFILTAAHCTVNFEEQGSSPFRFPRNILAIVRQPTRCSNRFLGSKFKYSIAKVYNHPKYEAKSSGQLIFDFALLQTQHSMAPFDMDLRPICLPPIDWWENSFVHMNAFIAGYGRTTKTEIQGQDTTSCVLKLGKTSLLAQHNEKCTAVSSSPGEQICGWDPEVDACSGDSGGPLSIKQDYDNRIQIGVVSYGSSDCAHSRAAGVYSRLTRVMKWVVAKIQSGECLQ